MLARPVLALIILSGLAGAALADDAAPPSTATATTLPTFATNPQAPWTAAGTPAPSPWAGLYVGSEVFAGSSKGRKGFAGGDAYIGYGRELDNNIVVGIDASTGFSASTSKRSPFGGYEFATTNMKVGYQMGRLTPYLTAGFGFAKPTTGYRFSSPSDSLNDLFSSSKDIRGVGMVGAGFDYALTDNLHVGLGLSAMTVRGGSPVTPLIAP